MKVDRRDGDDQILDPLRIERGVTERKDATFADAQDIDALEPVRATDELDALVEVAIDIVVDRQPPIPRAGFPQSTTYRSTPWRSRLRISERSSCRSAMV
jgi:hypothetical protein